jgi:hypothetical protein
MARDSWSLASGSREARRTPARQAAPVPPVRPGALPGGVRKGAERHPAPLSKQAGPPSRQWRQQPVEPPSRRLPGLVEHVNVPGGGPQVGLAEPVHDRLRALAGVDQPRGMRVPHLVRGRLELDPAGGHRSTPDPVPGLLVQVRLVRVPRLRPASPRLPGFGTRRSRIRSRPYSRAHCRQPAHRHLAVTYPPSVPCA